MDEQEGSKIRKAKVCRSRRYGERARPGRKALYEAADKGSWADPLRRGVAWIFDQPQCRLSMAWLLLLCGMMFVR